MSWLASLWRRAPPLDEALAARLAAWRVRGQAEMDVDIGRRRLVVVDVESSGLDPRHDRLISIGAVAVQGGAVQLADAFETTLRQDRPSSGENILVHHIGGTAQVEGREPNFALMDFLEFVGKAPLVGFNADFDCMLIERAMRARLGVVPAGPWLDLAALAPALFPDRAREARTLDDWLREFAIENHDRHNALADAVATAQFLLPVLVAARAQKITTSAQLRQLQEGYLWLRGGRA
jgi:DNA polymerase-3 subunit epsilon